jgi:hypothetical protein
VIAFVGRKVIGTRLEVVAMRFYEKVQLMSKIMVTTLYVFERQVHARTDEMSLPVLEIFLNNAARNSADSSSSQTLP